MAFIFNPNPSEGDKQTNPDTGVEYIYSSGAWRALGPKIEDEFDTLDDRYVKLTGTTRTTGTWKIKGDNETGDGEQTYQSIGGGYQKLYHIQTPEDSNTGWVANVEYVQQKIAAIPDVDLSGYLPLTGGTLTGRLTIEQPRTDSNTNCFVIKGRIKDGSNNLTEGILLKSYKRQNSSSSADYLDYYGESGGGNELLNRKTAQAEFASKSDLDSINLDNYLPLSGGTLTGTLSGQLIKSIRSGNGYAIEVKPGDTDTKAFIRTDGTSKLSSLTVESPLASPSERPFEIKGRLSDGSTVSKDFFYAYANSDGTPSAMNYKGKMDNEHNLVTKGYVDNAVSTSGSGVPVGSIMIWMNSTAPPGWFKLQGGSFSTTTYPQLHAYLQTTHGYTNGRLPNWSGYYPGEYGDHLTHDLGSKQGYKTGMPSGGAPYHPNSIPNGNTRTFNATGGTNAYSDGKARPAITEGWDTTTRPKTVVVHYIIKHD